MEKLNSQQWLLVFVLASLTALGPLSIDMYLPAFPQIAIDLQTPISNVQISLSSFLAGLAVGQLFWGPLSDRFGYKMPLAACLTIFMMASYACTAVDEIEYLWMLRFLQAFGSSGGIVMARAIVNTRFDKDQTLKIFSILALVGGIAPIIAPILGNGILLYFEWRYLFVAMLLFGLFSFAMTQAFLKEAPRRNTREQRNNAWESYLDLFKNKSFLIYTLIGSVSFSSLMLYISNSPILVMEKGGLSTTAFSLIFGINSCGLMLGAFLTSTILQKKLNPQAIIRWACSIQILAASLFLALLWIDLSIYVELVALFFFILPLGMLFPTSTTLALQPFKENSGAAAALFGASQLAFTALLSIVVNHLSEGSMLVMAFGLLCCALVSLVANAVVKK